MVAMLIMSMLLPWDEPTPYPVIEGKSTYYSIRTMEEVARNRGMELGDHIGYVAMNRKGDLSRTVWVQYLGNDKELYGQIIGPLLVCDVAQEGSHYEDRERKNFIVELSYLQAMEWKMRGPIKVRVFFVEPIPDPPNAY